MLPNRKMMKSVHLRHEEEQKKAIDELVNEVMQIGRYFATLPVLDPRDLDAMLYDENGLPSSE